MARSEMKVRVNSSAVGIDGEAMNAAATSNFIETQDASELTIKFKTATRVAFTAIHFTVSWYGTSEGSPTAYNSLGGSAAQDGTNTVTTLEPDKYTRTTSATVTGECFSIPVKDRFCKIVASSTAGDATDLIYVELTIIKTA